MECNALLNGVVCLAVFLRLFAKKMTNIRSPLQLLVIAICLLLPLNFDVYHHACIVFLILVSLMSFMPIMGFITSFLGFSIMLFRHNFKAETP